LWGFGSEPVEFREIILHACPPSPRLENVLKCPGKRVDDSPVIIPKIEEQKPLKVH
jgi:hypothetical protein